MAVASLPASSSASGTSPPPTPIHRLGEQAFDIIADVGDVAIFTFLTFSWMFLMLELAPVGPGPKLLRDRRLERAGRGDHRDVYRHGVAVQAKPVR